MMMRSPNCTIVYDNGSQIPVDLHDQETDRILPFPFYRSALQILQEQYALGHSSFFIVDKPTTPLPRRGEDVIVLIFADEGAGVVPYANDVRATFRSYGTRPDLMLSANSTRRRISETWRFASDYSCRLAASWREAGLGGAPRSDNVFSIPPDHQPMGVTHGRPVLERRYSLTFCGSVRHVQRSLMSPRRLIGTPKDLARAAMMGAAQTACRRFEITDACLIDSGSFNASIARGRGDYARIMLDTKIALAPRGTHFETPRLFEALSAGCIVVSERLPDRWYYRNSPIIQLDEWSDFADIVGPLLANPEEMRRLQAATIRYRELYCSPPALARFMAESMGLASS